ncbi:TRAP transporter large permease subunit [Billgrantia diversa]|uniref:TRAP transporter large permease n=1 Tax=Halomonas sp. MCCC 1A13316 TaxID=2733487 RepID=UPI0018A63A26|nr:TRAP transporter large permease subunit [Halomonas sp. MCCC 1A13316]QOR37448.1 TRAP transporter large permease subunit [Halomonas sp. MCCC 1A13316]
MEFFYDWGGYISIFLLFLLMLLTVPVFVAMGISAFVASLLLEDPSLVFRTFIQTSWQGASIFELVALPLFILTGTIMQRTDAGADLFEVTKAWIGSVPNSLGVATITACGIFAAISGSSIATAATVGLVAIPLLVKEGYGERRAGGFVAGGGTLGIIIPPSIPLILYGVITETSIGQLFIAGVVPGIIMMSFFVLYVLLSRPRIKSGLSVSATVPSPTSAMALQSEPSLSYTTRDKLAVTRRTIGVVLLPVVIITAIYTGIFTPTEVGALSVLYVVALGAGQKRLTLAKLKDAAVMATATTSMLVMLIVFGQYFAHFLTFEQVPQAIAQAIIEAASGVGAVTLMILAYIVLGMFLESAAMLLISIPIFLPVAIQVGMEPIVFGIFACIAMEIAQISPPIGVNLFTIHGISKIKLGTLARGAAPFLLIQIGMLYLVYFFPEIVLWLPNSMR